MTIETILLLYNRPKHTHAVLESLARNGVKRLRAFMDYSDDPHVRENQAAILKYIAQQKEIHVDLYRHTAKQGLAGSVRFALNHVFEDADAAIVIEDDCVVRRGGMQFFCEGLEALASNPRVRSLCGYVFPCDFTVRDNEFLVLNRFSPWGWATWKDRWKDYRSDLRVVVKDLEKRNMRVEEFASDIAHLCRSEEYLNNGKNIWSINWILEHYVDSTFAVYPRQSIIENIGFDGSGENCVVSPDFMVASPKHSTTQNTWDTLPYYVENEERVRKFLEAHGLKTYPPPK
jgi:hypothetical protein